MHRLPLLLLLALAALPATAAIYKHVDAKGNVYYTDQPGDASATEVQLPPVNQMPSGRVDTAGNPRALPEAVTPAAAAGEWQGYTSLELSGVPPNGTLRDPQDPITISAKMYPPLRPGDHVRIYHNGAPRSEAASYTIPLIERGTHTFRAEILDSAGKLLKASPDLVVHVLRFSAINSPQARQAAEQAKKAAAEKAGKPYVGPTTPVVPSAPSGPMAPKAPKAP